MANKSNNVIVVWYILRFLNQFVCDLEEDDDMRVQIQLEFIDCKI